MRTDTVHKMPEMRADSAAAGAKFFPQLAKGIAVFVILAAAYYCGQMIAILIFVFCSGPISFFLMPYAFPLAPLIFLCFFTVGDIALFVVLPIIIIALPAWKTARGGRISAKSLIIGAAVLASIFAGELYFQSFYVRDIQELYALIAAIIREPNALIAIIISWLICVPVCLRFLRKSGLMEVSVFACASVPPAEPVMGGDIED